MHSSDWQNEVHRPTNATAFGSNNESNKVALARERAMPFSLTRCQSKHEEQVSKHVLLDGSLRPFIPHPRSGKLKFQLARNLQFYEYLAVAMEGSSQPVIVLIRFHSDPVKEYHFLGLVR